MITTLAFTAAYIFLSGVNASETQPPKNKIFLKEAEVQIYEGKHLRDTPFMGTKEEAHKKLMNLRKQGLPDKQRAVLKAAKPPHLLFYDDKGVISRDLPLETKFEMKEVSVSGSTVSIRAQIRTSNMATVSPNHDRASHVECTGRMYLTGGGKEGEDESSCKIRQLDQDGGLLWEHEMPPCRESGPGKMSADGKRLFTIQGLSECYRPRRHKLNGGSEPPNQLVVYNEKGSIIFVFPKKGGESVGLHGENELAISPNGRYAALRARKGRGETVIFLDIEGNLYGEFGKEGFPLDIDDKGLARVGLMSGARVESFDASKVLGSIK